MLKGILNGHQDNLSANLQGNEKRLDASIEKGSRTKQYTGKENENIEVIVDNTENTIEAVLKKDLVEKVSELENDGDGTSPFATQKYVDEHAVPEDLIERVDNLEEDVETISGEIDTINTDINNINNDIDTINENIVTLSGGVSDNAQAIQELENDVDALETAVTGINGKLNNQVSIKQTSDNFSYDGDTVKFKQKFKNLNTGAEETTEEVVSLADSDNAGLMSPSDVQALADLRDEVDRLAGRNIRLLFTAKDDPTAIEINAFVLSKGYTVADFPSISVVVRGTNHIWRYSENPAQWLDYGIDTVNQATNQMLGIVKGTSNVDGKVYVENDGSMSVYGWDSLSASIPTKTSDLTNDSGFIDKSVNDLTNYTKTSALGDLATQDSIDYTSNQITNKPTIPTQLSQLSGDTTHRTVTDSEKTTWNNKSDFSGSYNDLIDKPTIPTVNNGTLTITQGGVSKGTFSANQSGNTTVALDKELFYCTYGTTTYAQVTTALSENKLPVCKYDDYLYKYIGTFNNRHGFGVVIGEYVKTIFVRSLDSLWQSIENVNLVSSDIGNTVQGKLTAGNGITINNGTISLNNAELITSGWHGDTSTITADFSKYKFLIVEGLSSYGTTMGSFIVDLNGTYTPYFGILERTVWDASFNTYLMLTHQLEVNSAKTQATVKTGFYYGAIWSGDYGIGKVWGIK